MLIRDPSLWLSSSPLLLSMILTAQPAYHPSLISYLSSLGASLPSAPYAYGQYLEALLSQSAAPESESRISDVVSE
ncbi:hypothetical protein Tco_1159648 [Tanacetum coccineum]